MGVYFLVMADVKIFILIISEVGFGSVVIGWGVVWGFDGEIFFEVGIFF